METTDDNKKKPLRLRAVKPRSQVGYARPRTEKALAEGDIQGVIDSLTPQQRRFCEEYIGPCNYNGSEAVVKAGYKCKYPNRQAYQLLRNPGVRTCIDQLTLQRADQSLIKPEYVIRKVIKTIEKAENENNHNAVLRGCELMARHLGMFIERQEISGPNGNPIELKAVRDAADAFTSAIAGLVDRNKTGLKLVGSD